MTPAGSNCKKVKQEEQQVMLLQSQMSDAVGFWDSIILWTLVLYASGSQPVGHDTFDKPLSPKVVYFIDKNHNS